MEDMDVFRRYVAIADAIWRSVECWPSFPRDTVGRQLVRDADSVGADLVEGDGRLTDPDAVRFFVIARASARETRYWLERAATRGLLDGSGASEQIQALTEATKILNRLISYRRSAGTVVREDCAGYDDPSPDDLVVGGLAETDTPATRAPTA